MGCGAVGVEFASVLFTLGAETTRRQLLPRLVPLEDEEVRRTRQVVSQARHQVTARHQLEKLEKTDKGVLVTGKTSKGEAVKLEDEMLLVAVGRMPFTQAWS